MKIDQVFIPTIGTSIAPQSFGGFFSKFILGIVTGLFLAWMFYEIIWKQKPKEPSEKHY